jgi:hypothetical protein
MAFRLCERCEGAVNQRSKLKHVHMAVDARGHAFDKMEVFAVPDRNGTAGQDDHLMVMIQEVRIGTNAVKVAFSAGYCFTCYSGEAMVVAVIPLFREFGATEKLVHMHKPLDSCGSGEFGVFHFQVDAFDGPHGSEIPSRLGWYHLIKRGEGKC